MYQTGKMTDLNTCENIAREVNSIFGEESLIEEDYNRLDRQIRSNEGIKKQIYNYKTATVIVAEILYHEFFTEKKEMSYFGVVICKWACDNPIVNKYIEEQLDKIDGIKKDNTHYHYL